MYDPARGYPRIVPYLTYPDVEDAVRWLVHVFGFVEHVRLRPAERIRHAELRLGTCVVMLGVAGDRFGAVRSITQVFVDDVDQVCTRAVEAGGELLEGAVDEPWGLRQAVVADPHGMRWEVTEFLAEVPPEEWGAELVEPFPSSGLPASRR
jgi:uncharacterized glyoxalase superfamily protein PhnB